MKEPASDTSDVVVRLCNLHTLCGFDDEELPEEPELPEVAVGVLAEADSEASPDTEVPDASPPANAAIGGPGNVYDAEGS